MKRYSNLRWLLVSITLMLMSVSIAFAQNRAMTAVDLLDLSQVSQVALSPDAQNVAYVRVVPPAHDEAKGRNKTEIWLVPFEGGDSRQFTSAHIGARSVAWSPDGKMLSFLARRTEYNDNTQVYGIPVDGGEARLLTRHASSVGRYAWSPDGSKIAFFSRDPLSADEKTAQKMGDDEIVFDANQKHTRLWVWDLAADKGMEVYKEDKSAWDFAWAPDGSKLAIQATDEPNTDASMMYRRIYEVPTAGGALRQICETEGKLGGMTYSPDGKTLAFAGAVSLNDPLAQSAFVVDVASGNKRNLSEGFEGSVNALQWLDKQTLIVLSTIGTTTTIQKIDTRNGSASAVFADVPVIYSMDLHTKTGRIAMTRGAASHPGEAYTATIKGGTPKRLTDSNPALKDIRLAKQEVVEWTAEDGMRIEGVLTYPLDYQQSRRYPLLLQIHGGPEGVSLNDWRTRSTYPVQIYAAHGYMVLEPNYRGSAGRGVAFAKADHDDLGGKEFEDVLAGIDALVERGLVDRERVGTGGWSYGGYFSAWAATKHSNAFKAAVMSAGISNWVSFSGTTDIPHEMALVHWNHYWYKDPALHWTRSPLSHLKTARTPTLIIHGEVDARVHPGQSQEMYYGFKHNGIPVEYVLYPREPHGLTERAHKLDYIKRTLGWFDRYVRQSGTN